MYPLLMDGIMNPPFLSLSLSFIPSHKRQRYANVQGTKGIISTTHEDDDNNNNEKKTPSFLLSRSFAAHLAPL